MLNSSFDWDGFRAPYVVATENDSKNGLGMMIGNILTGGVPQMFADIRTNWTPASIKKATGVDVSKICPNGIIDKRNSGAAALDYAVDIFKLVKGSEKMSVNEVWNVIKADKKLQARLMELSIATLCCAQCFKPLDGIIFCHLSLSFSGISDDAYLRYILYETLKGMDGVQVVLSDGGTATVKVV